MRTTGAERRRFARWEATFPLAEISPEQHIWRSSSVGAGGMFCPDAGPRPIGSELTVEVDLSDSFARRETIRTRARVVRVGSNQGFGLGLEFLEPVAQIAHTMSGLP